eukprot:760900-Hanusia_phi.AAC.5
MKDLEDSGSTTSESMLHVTAVEASSCSSFPRACSPRILDGRACGPEVAAEGEGGSLLGEEGEGEGKEHEEDNERGDGCQTRRYSDLRRGKMSGQEG